MSRKHCARKVWLPVPPKGLRPKLDSGQRVDLGLVHIINLDDIANGRGTEDLLWHWVGSVLTWSHAASMLGQHIEAMTEQLQLATQLVERYGRTGRVAFDGPGYQLAKAGLKVMDDLASTIDRPRAIAACEVGERRVQKMVAAIRQQQRQQVAA